MSEKQISKSNFLLTILGCLGAFLVFGLIIFIAYLPNRPPPVDSEIIAERQIKADEARAAGIKKISNLEIIDLDAGIARIPIEDAMLLAVSSYLEDDLNSADNDRKKEIILSAETSEFSEEIIP